MEEISNERMKYLKSLSHDYQIDLDIIISLAILLGSNEDYDGLITSLEDILADM